jgi:hypothetical protein
MLEANTDLRDLYVPCDPAEVAAVEELTEADPAAEDLMAVEELAKVDLVENFGSLG